MGKMKGSNISGAVGKIVFAGDTVRIRGKRTAKWSERQIIQRSRISAVATLYNELKYSIVVPLWQNDVKRKLTPYNLFVEANTSAFNKNGELADPCMLKIMRGVLPVPFAMEISLRDLVIDVTWEYEKKDIRAREKDVLCAVFFDGEYFSEISRSDARRKDNMAEILIPDGYEKGDYIYLFFANDRKDMFSDSSSFKIS